MIDRIQTERWPVARAARAAIAYSSSTTSKLSSSARADRPGTPRRRGRCASATPGSDRSRSGSDNAAR
ncbi:MAG: hypothetical protein IIA30_08250 [Myxococcales bacterium]|nr:hypothetical protein [Myxococcales bacterium]